MAEVELLRKFAESKEITDAVGLRHEINALCRGAIVLLCSHLEAYIKELGELALDSLYTQKVPRTALAPRFFYHISKKAIAEIRETADHDKLAEKVFQFLKADASYWSSNGPFPVSILADQFNKGFSNPGYGKVKSYFHRFGHDDYHRQLAVNLKANFLPVTTMVDNLVDTRNKIAHGDPAATLTPKDVKTMMASIKSYCRATDEVFATWWKNEFCSIR